MLRGDRLRKQKKCVEYKQQTEPCQLPYEGGREQILCDVAGNKADIPSMWRSINTLTMSHSPVNNDIPSELIPDFFNARFVSELRVRALARRSNR